MIGSEHCGVILGTTLYGPSDEPIGVIGQVYLDDTTSQPAWLTVHTGLFGTHESFVPVAGARIVERGVIVGFNRDLVRHAPRVDPADGLLSESDEAVLYKHYGLFHDDAREQPQLRRFADDTDSRPPQSPAQGDVIDITAPARDQQAR